MLAVIVKILMSYKHGKIDFLKLDFCRISSVPPRITSPVGSLVEALPGYSLSCSVSGTPPIYTALIRNSTVLVNTTKTASTQVHEEGNYTCIATSKSVFDKREFTVIFNGKGFFYLFTQLKQSN